jgi:hypothetical protein
VNFFLPQLYPVYTTVFNRDHFRQDSHLLLDVFSEYVSSFVEADFVIFGGIRLGIRRQLWFKR